jgi:hypothetical protein
MSRRRPAPAAAAVAPPGPAGPALRAAAIALGLTLALRALAAFVCTNWLWGFDVFRPWPLPVRLAFVALSLAGFVPFVAAPVGRALESIGAAWTRAGRAADIAAALLVALLLALLRDPMRYPGDFALRVGAIGMAVPSAQILAHAFPLDRLFGVEIPRRLASAGLAPDVALQLVSAFVGGLFDYVVCRFLRASGARGGALAAGALAAASGGLYVHFAGYGKFGPLALGLALAALGAVRLARTGAGLLPLAAGAAIALLSHRSAFLLLPAVAIVLGQAWRAAPEPRARGRVLVAAGAVALAGGLVLRRSIALLLQFDRSVHLPGGAIAHARESAGALPVLVRFADGINALAYVAPLSWVGLSAMLAAPRAASAHEDARFSLRLPAALALVAFLALPFGVEPAGGWVRDWDVAVGTGALLALAGAYALVRALRSAPSPAALAPVALGSLAISLASFGLHVSEPAASLRIETLAEATPRWSDATRAATDDVLGARALNTGQPARAAALFERAIAVGGPNPRLLYQAGLAHAAAGDPARAADRFVLAARANPAVASPWAALAQLAEARGDTASARAFAESALTRDPGEARALRVLDGVTGGARR